MKTTIRSAAAWVALLAVVSLSSTALAQNPVLPQRFANAQASAAGKGMGHGKLGALLKQLNLTDSQKAQIKSIMKSERPQIKSIRQDATLTADQKKEKRKAVRKDMMTQILGVLTPEQKKRLAELRPHHKKKAGAAASSGAAAGSTTGTTPANTAIKTSDAGDDLDDF